MKGIAMQSKKRLFAARAMRWAESSIGSGLIVLVIGAACGCALAMAMAGG